jgi:hypothetical protein
MAVVGSSSSQIKMIDIIAKDDQVYQNEIKELREQLRAKTSEVQRQ